MRRFVQWLPVLILIPLWGGGLVLDRIAERVLLDSVHERMVTALHAHREHVLAALAHQQRGLKLFATGAVQALAEGRAPRLDAGYLTSLLPEVVGCVLLDAERRPVTRIGAAWPPLEEIAVEFPPGTAESRVTDPHQEPTGSSVYDVYVPLKAASGGRPSTRSNPQSAVVGTLACRLRNTLSAALAEHRAGLGLSGEAYLVSAKTRLMLTESRFIPNAIGRVNVDTIGVREALKMRNGIAPYPDYRGIPVVGTFLYLRDYDWVLLAEMDEAEALAPLRRLRMVLGLSLGLISVAAGAVGWRYGRQLSAVYAQTEDARDQAQQGEAQVKALLRSMADAVFEIDESSTILIANESAHRMFGWPSGELIGRNVTVLMPPEDVSRHEAGLRRYLETGESRIIGKVVEVTGRRRDGSPFPCELSVAVVLLPDGTRRFIGVHRDVTERLQAHTALKASEEKHRSLFENMLEGFAYCRMLYEHGKPEDFIYLDVNSAFERLTGLRNVVGRRVTEVIPNIRQTNPELFEIYGRVASTGTPERFETYLKPLATWFSISVYSTQPEHFIAMFDNITERKQAEEELEQTHAALNAQYRELQGTYVKIEQAKKEWEATFDAIADPLFIHDRAFRLVRANQAYADAAGMPPAELIGKLYYEVFPKMEGPCKVCLKAGELQEEEEEEEVVSQTKTYRMLVYPLHDGPGGAVTIHIMQDITERKTMETHARRLEQLAAMGQLLGGISHEMKNPLFVLTGRLQLLKEKLACREYDRLGSDLQKIEGAAQRMTGIAQRFLTLARPTPPSMQSCSVQDTLEKVLDFLSNELMKHRIRTVREWEPALSKTQIWSDPQSLHQIFLNLMLNAMQAMTQAHGQGTLTVATAISNGWIEVRIQDDGPGIPLQHHDKLFDPFFTTKAAGAGTGLGLWTVRVALTELKGQVTFETEVGRGTTFVVRLPLPHEPLPAGDRGPAEG